MEGEIINRVANSKLKTIDLEDFYPEGKRVVFDISDWLFEGLILKEKDFREKANSFHWSEYQDCFVAITCSTDAIIPSWAYLLLSTKLNSFAKQVVTGNLELLETVIYQKIISEFDVSVYENLPVIIKGCANKPIPASAFNFLIDKLQSVVKSIMFGEACSSVPLFKK